MRKKNLILTYLTINYKIYGFGWDNCILIHVLDSSECKVVITIFVSILVFVSISGQHCFLQDLYVHRFNFFIAYKWNWRWTLIVDFITCIIVV